MILWIELDIIMRTKATPPSSIENFRHQCFAKPQAFTLEDLVQALKDTAGDVCDWRSKIEQQVYLVNPTLDVQFFEAAGWIFTTSPEPNQSDTDGEKNHSMVNALLSVGCRFHNQWCRDSKRGGAADSMDLE